MVNALSKVFDILGEAAVALVVFVFILAFGALLLVDLEDQVVDDYLGGNASLSNNATVVIAAGEEGILDFSDNIGIIVLAIVFVIVLGLIMLLKSQNTSS